MKKSWTMVFAVLFAAGGFVAFWYLAPRSASFGMFEGEGKANIARLAISFSATIAGVVLGSAYRQLRALQASGASVITDVPAFLSTVLRSIDLWLGLVGAPIVYALLLQSTDGMSLPGLLLVALENGFCCLLIVNAFVGRTEAELQRQPHPANPPNAGGGD